MPQAHFSPQDSESDSARGGGPIPSGEQAVDWDVWDELLAGSEPAPTLVKRIPSDQRNVYFSALVDALPPGATRISLRLRR